MAFIDKMITNTKTGQSFKFIQTAESTNGKLLEIESVFKSNSIEPPAHYHPFQFEDFIILEGELTVKINGNEKVLKQGDTIHITPNTVHSMWDQSQQTTVVNWKVQPAMQSEFLFETITGLANNNKTNEEGRPAFLQIVSTTSKFSDEFRLANPPFAVQKILFALVKPIAYLFGFRATYEKYLD